MPCRTCVLRITPATPVDIDPWGGPWATHILLVMPKTFSPSRNVYGSGSLYGLREAVRTTGAFAPVPDGIGGGGGPLTAFRPASSKTSARMHKMPKFTTGANCDAGT